VGQRGRRKEKNNIGGGGLSFSKGAIAMDTSTYTASSHEHIDFASLIGAVAIRIFGHRRRGRLWLNLNPERGKPNWKRSKELRWGTNGSKKVDLRKALYSNYEADVHGGFMDMMKFELGLEGREVFAWLRKEGFISDSGQINPEIVVTARANGTASLTKPEPEEPSPVYPYGEAGPPEEPNEVRRHAYYRNGCVVKLKIKYDDGRFKQCYRVSRDGWQWRKPKDFQPVPYITQPFDAYAEVFNPEGEKDVDALGRLGFPAFTFGGTGELPEDAKTLYTGVNLIICLDNDDAGRNTADRKAHFAHAAGARRIRIFDPLQVWPECPKGGDVSDWLDEGGETHDALLTAVAALPDWQPPPYDNPPDPPPIDDQKAHEEVAKLAKMSEFDYQRQRKVVAERLGVTVSALDREVQQQRQQGKRNEKSLELPHWQVEPWDTEVSVAELLSDIIALLRRYIILPEYSAEAIALWVLHAWAFDAWDISGFLFLKSPTKRCGKTRTFKILNYITPRSEFTSNISTAAIFRYIEASHPTLLIDEGDSFLGFQEETRGILNAGHDKSAAYVIRNVEVAGEHQPARFSVWAPKAFAAIGDLPDTIEDRSIIVPMQRRPAGKRVERLRSKDTAECADIRRQAVRWVQDNIERLKEAQPALPEALDDRAADNWEPLLAIADLAGPEWSTKARVAALNLSGEEVTDDRDIGVTLLHDIYAAFGAGDNIFTKDLLKALTADTEKAWATFKHDRPLTDRGLAKLLKPFGVRSDTVRQGAEHNKGYRKADFLEVWERYAIPKSTIPPAQPTSQACQRDNADETGTSCTFASVTQTGLSRLENGQKLNNHEGCHGFTPSSLVLMGGRLACFAPVAPSNSP
jgi:putative DNA primase/helicase